MTEALALVVTAMFLAVVFSLLETVDALLLMVAVGAASWVLGALCP